MKYAQDIDTYTSTHIYTRRNTHSRRDTSMHTPTELILSQWQHVTFFWGAYSSSRCLQTPPPFFPPPSSPLHTQVRDTGIGTGFFRDGHCSTVFFFKTIFFHDFGIILLDYIEMSREPKHIFIKNNVFLPIVHANLRKNVKQWLYTVEPLLNSCLEPLLNSFFLKIIFFHNFGIMFFGITETSRMYKCNFIILKFGEILLLKKIKSTVTNMRLKDRIKWYRVAQTHRMPWFHGSISAKEPYNYEYCEEHKIYMMQSSDTGWRRPIGCLNF